jgi:DNA-binding CsgD family transcriptional regulator
VKALAALIMSRINLGNAAELLPICRAAFLDEQLVPRDRFILGLALLAGYTYEQDFDGAAAIYSSLRPYLTVDALRFNSFELLNFYLIGADDFQEWLALRPMMLDWIVRNPEANFTRNASVRLLWMHCGQPGEVERNWADARELVAFDLAQNQNRASVYSSLMSAGDTEEVPVFKVVISPDFQLAFWASGVLGALLAGAGIWWWMRRKVGQPAVASEASTSTLSDLEMHMIARLRRHLESNGPDEFGLVMLDQLQNGRRDPIVEKLKATYPDMNLSETEGEVLFLSIHGYSGKEIARIIDVSQGHVYNIRTQLKNLLGLEDNDFKGWYRSLT